MEKALPYSTWCYVCGMDNPLGFKVVFRADGERVKLRYTPEAPRQGYLGMVHGGVISTLLDEAMGWAATLQAKRFFVTGELTVRYLRPFPVGDTMVLEAWTEKVSRRVVFSRGEVRDVRGGLYVTSTGKYLPMSIEETIKINNLLIYEPDTMRLFSQEGMEKD